MTASINEHGALEMRFPRPDRPVSENEARSLHWAALRRRLDPWREATRAEWLNAREMRDQVRGKAAQVEMQLPFSRGGRRDPSNYIGTVVKAVVDQLVFHGCWPDDTPQWVRILEPRIVIGEIAVIRIAPTYNKTHVGSRAVIRKIEAGNDARCIHCQEYLRFSALPGRRKQMQIICNVYVDDKWDHVEHYHPGCYEAAGIPYGEAHP